MWSPLSHLRDFILAHPDLIDISFFDILRLCIEQNFFPFNNNFYRLTLRMPIGSPIFPILANIFKELSDNIFFQDCLTPALNWFRYVDDTFVILDEGMNIKKMVDNLNDWIP